jgi:hypothetical protein
MAIGCLVGGSVVFFTVGYHNRVTTCKAPAVKSQFISPIGKVTVCEVPR